MAELPTGTVTLVFTDIEGSTRLLETLGESYGEVLSEHRSLLRQAFSSRGGIEVDTQGDAFFYAFPRATDAVVATAEAQRALTDHPWPRQPSSGSAWGSTPGSRPSPMKATWELTSIARRASGVSSAEPCLARSAVQCWPSLRSLNLIVTAVHAKDTILVYCPDAAD